MRFPNHSTSSRPQPQSSDPLADIIMSIPVYQLNDRSSEDSSKNGADAQAHKDTSNGIKQGTTKSQKLREKNRRAQQKFREKKKVGIMGVQACMVC